jgi:hypothetical protein
MRRKVDNPKAFDRKSEKIATHEFDVRPEKNELHRLRSAFEVRAHLAGRNWFRCSTGTTAGKTKGSHILSTAPQEDLGCSGGGGPELATTEE